MYRVLNSAFAPLDGMTEHLKLADRMSEIFNTQNHISEIVNSCTPPAISNCDFLVNNFALPLSNLWCVLRKLGRSLYFIFLLRLFK